MTKHLKSFNLRLIVMFYFFGLTTVFLFLLWSLFYLVLGSAVMWAVVVAFSYFNIIKLSMNIAIKKLLEPEKLSASHRKTNITRN